MQILSFTLLSRMANEFHVVPPRGVRLKTHDYQEQKKVLYVVLENCSLETAKIGKDYVLLASDKHATFLKKNKKDPADYRPDIVHQCLLNLLDSPLNRAGRLQVFIRTAKNVLIEVSPQCRIPRTFDRFSGLMIQLLHKLCVRAADTSVKLLKVIKNPVNDHLPIGARKLLFTYAAPELTLPNKLVNPDDDKPLVVVIGGIARGMIVTDYTEHDVKISNFPLSAALCCAKVTSGLEEAWDII